MVVSIVCRLAPEAKIPQFWEDFRDACEWVGAKCPGLFHRGRDRPPIALLSYLAAFVELGNGFRLPFVAPGIEAAIGPLRGVLPFPLVRKSLTRPSRVGARIFERDPGYRLIAPALREAPVLPLAKEVMIILGKI